MEQKHSVISPSGLYRVLACPGSVKESEHVPLQPPSQYAIRGTLQHEGVVRRWKGLNMKSLKLSQAEMNNVDDAVDYLRDLTSDNSGKLQFEVKGDLSIIGLPEIWGTADVRWETPKELHIIDWKFGQGVPVRAVEGVG